MLKQIVDLSSDVSLAFSFHQIALFALAVNLSVTFCAVR